MAQSAGGEKIIVEPLHFSGSARTIRCLGERFRDGQYNLVSLLFAAVPMVICKSGGGTCPVPYGVGATGNLHSSS